MSASVDTDAPASAAELLVANQLAWRVWQRAGQQHRDSPADAWLHGRGLTPEDLRAGGFAVGWADGDWHTIDQLLARHRIPHRVGLAAGLLRRSGTRIYDGFRDRIMLPVRGIGARGDICGFIGRTLHPDPAADGPPKYLNSPGNAAYRKGDVLFGGWEAVHRLGRRGDAHTLVVGEGPLDAIAVSAAGPWAGVAPCGTAMTAAQANWCAVIAEHTGCAVALAYDGDPAGCRAAGTAHRTLSAAGVTAVAEVELPTGEDPASLDRAALRHLLASAAATAPAPTRPPARPTPHRPR